MAENAKKVGRPSTRDSADPGAHVGFNTSRELKSRIEAAAGAAGRSLSSELQLRLTKSFDDESALEQALELAYGTQGAGVVTMLARVLRPALGDDAESDWLNNPAAFDRVVKAVNLALAILHPANAPPPVPMDVAEREQRQISRDEQDVGRALIAMGDPGVTWLPWVATQRKRLASAAERITAWTDRHKRSFDSTAKEGRKP